MNEESLSDFIINWNLRFKYDRKFRKKYNIPFGSEEHLKLNQIDIYIDLLEDRLFEKLEKEFVDNKNNSEEMKKTGKFLKEQVLSQDQEDSLFDKIRKSLKYGRKEG